MSRLPALMTIACLTLTQLLAGCQTAFPNDGRTPYGAVVTAAMTSQMLPPQAPVTGGADGVAAAAAIANYQHSYVTPVPHSDTAAFGAK